MTTQDSAKAAGVAKKAKKINLSARKRAAQNKRRNVLNRSYKSKTKTALQAMKTAVKENKSPNDRLKQIYSILDKGVKKKIFKRNKADRLKSRYSQLLLTAAK
jgi:small subunit ribosomal protein S20